MADFCRQCAQGMGFEGNGLEDLSRLSTEADTAAGLYCCVLCEGCGPIQVDHDGKCISDNCLVNHETGDAR